MNYRAFWCGFLFYVVGAIASTAAYAGKPLMFGIVPQESSSRLAEQWTPLMRFLSEHLGQPVRFSTAPDIPTFEKRVREGHYHIAYMNPYHYVEFSRQSGYRSIAREGNKSITGLVVVGENHPAETLEDLDGGTIAFPAPAAFAATILVKAELKRLGVSYTPRYISSHQSVYLNVHRGFAMAGGGIERTYNLAVREGLSGLRVLWRSEGFTPHAFAVHPDLPEKQAASIQRALIEMGNHAEGQALLERANLQPLVIAADSDWDDVRELGLDVLYSNGDP